jgi:hypothetical protein
MIWITNKHILFIHNPKCAGTAMHRLLLKNYPTSEIYWGRFYSSKLDEIIDLTHLSINNISNILNISHPFKSFGFVRHPQDRFVSAYWHLKVNNKSLDSLSMEDLAFDLLDEERIRFDWKFIHFSPQYRFFFEKSQLKVNYLWKIEAIQSIWPDICNFLDIKDDLKPDNVRVNCPILPISDRLNSRIALLYARDFELLKYNPIEIMNNDEFNSPCLYPNYTNLWPERRHIEITDRYKR